jgi:hypothetical protein
MVLGLLACGGPLIPDAGQAPDAGTPQQMGALTAPPGADVLPDGGTTPDGGPASDADRLRTQLGWFAAQPLECTVTLDRGATTRTYQNVTMQIADGSGGFSLTWTMVMGSTDTYSFSVVFDDNASVSLRTTAAGVELDYDGYFLDYYHQFLTFSEPTVDPTQHASAFRLATYSDFSQYNVACDVR